MKGEIIRRKLVMMGKSQTDLARMLKVSPQSVSKILNSEDVRSATLERICHVLDIPVSSLYGEKGGENLSTLAEVGSNRNTPTVPSDVAAAYLKGKRDGYDEALALMGTAPSNENKKEVV